MLTNWIGCQRETAMNNKREIGQQLWETNKGASRTMQVVKYVFQPHGDERGQLIALEEFKDIPFRIKRVYYMYDTAKGVTRGFHAHKKLQQILICIHGSCKIRLDNGKEKKVVPLEKPYEGLYIANNMWREMFDFSPDAVLMVLASEIYDETDYIRNYDEFLKFVNDCESTTKNSSNEQTEKAGQHVVVLIFSMNTEGKWMISD